MARLFIGVWPPRPVRDRIARSWIDGADVRRVPIENLHITLRFFGEAEPDDVVAAIGGARLPPAHAVVGSTLLVMSGGAVALPVEGLDALAAVLIERTSHVGRPPGPSFRCHLTVARLKRGTRRLAAQPRFPGAEFDVQTVALIRSTLAADHAHYETVHTWSTG